MTLGPAGRFPSVGLDVDLGRATYAVLAATSAAHRCTDLPSIEIPEGVSRLAGVATTV
jgi:hypothetical protein